MNSDLETQRWGRLLRWLSEEHGMDVTENALHVEPREVEGAGRGLIASRNCSPSTTLFKVPSTALLNSSTVLKLYPQIRGRKLSGVQLVSLHLLLHKPLGDANSLDNAFGPYISTLPRSFCNHPLTWMVRREVKQTNTWESQILEHLPPSTYQRLSALHQRFWADWRTVSTILTDGTIVASHSSRLDLHTMSFDEKGNADVLLDYLWAWLNVNTRCIFYRVRTRLSDPDNFTLCPILDFANHSCGSTHIFPTVDSEAWSTAIKKPPKHFVFSGPPQASLSASQELYLQYGCHSNSFLFCEYGFVNDVPQGAITSGKYPGEVSVQELVEELFAGKGALGSRLRSTLEDDGYWGDWTLHSSPTPAHPSYRLISALRLLHAFEDCPEVEGAQLEAVVDEWRNVTNGRMERISLQNEDSWRRCLVRLCEHIVNRARANLAATPTADGAGDGLGWQGWMTHAVRALWTEEYEVAEAVSASVLSGEDF